MGEFAKWAVLAAAFVVLIGAILALPVFSQMDNAVGAISRGINEIVGTAASYMAEARGFVNCLIFPGFEPLLTLVLGYVITKPFILWGIWTATGVYHWMFK